jgi:hypothetical protein
MPLKIIADSHVDHGLKKSVVDWIVRQFETEEGGRVIVRTFEIPAEYGAVPCGLYGPEMGDDPVPEYRTLTDAVHWETATAQPPEELAEEVLLSTEDKEHTANAGWIGINRGSRSWPSKIVPLPHRMTDKLTVVAGPVGDEPLVWFTAYGGPEAPQEPGDPNCHDKEFSGKFWQTHALATGKDDELTDKWIGLAKRYTRSEAAHGEKR